ncbi:FMN reductase [Mesorhizobium sp. CAU 1732]|uniref:FMN reductase n=1 Tax=Mesorhizobium sp. CAU 1732 TaxID=3140358 RepID=UPI003261637B
MTYSIVGFSGNITRPSRTRQLVDHLVLSIAERGSAQRRLFDIEDIGPSLGAARNVGQLDQSGQDVLLQIKSADLLVVGSPTYKGSYTGLFKHFFDLIEPDALLGKPVLLAATGGGQRHSLMIEHQLRPLFGFFQALTLPTGVYASAKDFREGGPVSSELHDRSRQAVEEALRLLPRSFADASIAAE